MSALAFINLPTGRDGRDEVAINPHEIASYRSHTVVSYSYEDWTEIVLKNGLRHDCRISKREFEKRLLAAMGVEQ